MKTKTILILLALVILVGVAGVFVFGGEKTQPAPEQPDIVANVEQNEYETLEFPNNTLDTSDWKTYRNEEFGFEVKYPSEWSVDEFKKGDLLGIIDEDGTGIGFKEGLSSVGSRIFFTHDSFSVVKDRKINWAENGNGTYSLIKMSGINGLKLVHKNESVMGQIEYSFGDEAKTITFINAQDKVEAVFEQILLSFNLVQ